MSGGGKGGTSTSSVRVPAWLEEAMRQNVSQAQDAAKIGFVPYSGPDVAALSPGQMAAMQGTNQAAQAFGVPQSDFMSGLPAAQDFGGVRGYSAAPVFQQAQGQIDPGQAAALNAPFIDPMTGQGGTSYAQQPATVQHSGGGNSSTPIAAPAGDGGGYTSFSDMFDGGGPGASGGAFQGGGLLSDFANARSLRRNQ